MDVSRVIEFYRFSFVGIPLDKQLELMGEALVCMLHASLNSDGGLLRKSDLSPGYAFEVYNADYGYRINIYRKGM